jgi:HD-GYP domain-containing protein (c-di-GMP phosphodiesterase class II)
MPDKVLKKPGGADANEHTIMQSHAERAADLLQRYPVSLGAWASCTTNESWDGTRYRIGSRA